MSDPDEDDAVPLIDDDIERNVRREFYARVAMLHPDGPRIRISHQAMLGGYTMSSEHTLEQLTLSEAERLLEALGRAVAAYHSRAAETVGRTAD